MRCEQRGYGASEPYATRSRQTVLHVYVGRSRRNFARERAACTAQVGALLAELSSLFPEQLVHLGGDEVDDTCWKVSCRCSPRQRHHARTHASEQHRAMQPVVGSMHACILNAIRVACTLRCQIVRLRMHPEHACVHACMCPVLACSSL